MAPIVKFFADGTMRTEDASLTDISNFIDNMDIASFDFSEFTLDDLPSGEIWASNLNAFRSRVTAIKPPVPRLSDLIQMAETLPEKREVTLQFGNHIEHVSISVLKETAKISKSRTCENHRDGLVLEPNLGFLTGLVVFNKS